MTAHQQLKECVANSPKPKRLQQMTHGGSPDCPDEIDIREENIAITSRSLVVELKDVEPDQKESSYLQARQKLENLLNKSMRIQMTDGRTLIGSFLCTDRDCNVILGSAQEYLKSTDSFSAGEPRVLGLAMVPGHHIVSISVELESLTPPQYL